MSFYIIVVELKRILVNINWIIWPKSNIIQDRRQKIINIDIIKKWTLNLTQNVIVFSRCGISNTFPSRRDPKIRAWNYIFMGGPIVTNSGWHDKSNKLSLW